MRDLWIDRATLWAILESGEDAPFWNTTLKVAGPDPQSDYVLVVDEAAFLAQ